MRTSRFSKRSSVWAGLGTASVLALALAGCGGGGDSGSSGGTAGGTSSVAAAAAPVPTGTAPVTLSASTPAATMAALAPTVTVGGVSINSPPVVTFAVADGAGNPIVGLGYTKQTATATLPSLAYLSFSLAKLVPGTNGSPSKWVSYIVTTVPTKTAPATLTRPSTDNTGTLVDNKNGTYSYTFYRDVKTIKDQVAAMTLTAPLSAADAGDLTYDPTLVHRLTIQVGGNAWGTGTQTADGSDSKVAPVAMKNPVNIVYDFIPATGKAVTATDSSRDIVATAKCQECHSKIGQIPGATKLVDDATGTSRVAVGATLHGGSRYETKYCVVCHNDQQRIGQTNVTSTSMAFPAITRTVALSTSAGAIPGIYSQSFSNDPAKSVQTNIADGVVVADFPVFIHKIHMGEALVKKNYNFAGAVLFNETTYPQQIQNCTKCHDGSDTSTAKTKDGDNWKNVPSRKACGACHDGIDFATNKGVNLADAAQGLKTSTVAHIGGVKTDDSQCVLCHTSADIPVYHVGTTTTYNVDSALPSNYASAGNLPSGAYKLEYAVTSVTLDSARKVSVKFQVKKDGAAVNFGTYNATTNPNIIPGTWGGPSLAIAYNVTQDGITSPADTNTYVSNPGVGVTAPSVNATSGLWTAASAANSVWANPAGVTSSGIKWTMTGPDPTNTYTITNDLALPAETTIVRAIMYGTITQTNLSGAYAYVNAAVADFKSYIRSSDGSTRYGLKKPGLGVTAKSSVGEVSGMARRVIVDADKCRACHAQLGLFTESTGIHSGSRNDATMCSVCHNPNNENQTNMTWTINFATWVHGIHGASKRTTPYTAIDPWGGVTYPGVLKNCEQCHTKDSYDFSNPVNSAAASKLLYSTVASGTAPAGGPSVVTAGAAYGAHFSYVNSTNVKTPAATTTLVNSPIAGACYACHDDSTAKGHMTANGGSIYEARSTAVLKTEQCLLCHSSTSQFGLGIKAVHAINNN